MVEWKQTASSGFRCAKFSLREKKNAARNLHVRASLICPSRDPRNVGLVHLFCTGTKMDRMGLVDALLMKQTDTRSCVHCSRPCKFIA